MVGFLVKKETSNSNFSFEVGQTLRHGSTIFRISEIHGNLHFLENLVTFEQKHILLEELWREYLAERLFPADSLEIERAYRCDQFHEDDNPPLAIPLTDHSKATKDNGFKKLRYIDELTKRGYTCLRPTTLLELEYKRLVKQFDDSSPPALSTIYTCSLNIEKAGGDRRAAFPRYADRGGRGKSRWTVEAESAYLSVKQAFEKDSKAKISVANFRTRMFEELRARVTPDQIFHNMPSPSSIGRRIKADFSEYEIHRRKHGKASADKKYATWYPRDRAVLPMEIVEFDDKDTRVFLYDNDTGLPCGRAYVTSGVDQFSTVPMGFSVSDQHRNLFSAKAAYINSVLPFDHSDPDFSELRDTPEFFGQIGTAIFDNAMYNHAADLNATIYDASPTTIVAWSKPRTPREKSCVEDFNGRMVEMLFSKIPGFGGPKSTIEGLAEGIETASLDVRTFRQTVITWAYNQYCNQPREGGLTPRQRWHQGQRNIKPRLPRSIAMARLAILYSTKRKFRSEGLLLTKGLPYQNARLIVLRRWLGANADVIFRYNPYDLGSIFVLDPRDRQYFRVPSIYPDYANGLSLYQHKLVLRFEANLKRTNPALRDLEAGKRWLMDWSRQLIVSKKRRERAKGKKLANGENPKSESGSTTAIEIVSEMEYQMAEFEMTQITMEAGEDGWDLIL